MKSKVRSVYEEVLYDYRNKHRRSIGLQTNFESENILNDSIKEELLVKGFSLEEINSIISSAPSEPVMYKFIAYSIGLVVSFNTIEELNQIIIDFNFDLSDEDIDIIMKSSKLIH